jgi:phosphoribosylaminoimidazole-succinocarboxamide synthase
VLTQMTLFWFERLRHIIPNHLTGEDPLSVVAPEERDQIRGRSMLVKRLKPLPVEAVVRGYLAGSAWKEYERTQSVCGVKLPAGLKNASKLPEPIFTPATKAAMGEHDENIDFQKLVESIGESLAQKMSFVSIDLYKEASEYAASKSLIVADTKFEFGIDDSGELILMDEILTPDSSRYWPIRNYIEGQISCSLDKQHIRDWLLSPSEVDGLLWNKRKPPPNLPAELIVTSMQKYHEVMKCLTA